MANNAFPGYEFIRGDDNRMHNMYRGTDLGFGGYVYAEPGMYGNVALLDVNSLHPNSIIQLNAFGEYTQRFKDILDARLYIKHKEFDKAGELMGGVLKPFLNDPEQAGQLANALKTAINSVYGLTSASFKNPFKDERNKNNIVALRGALFMRTLQDEVVKRGFVVAHIKTDSIKIPDATPEIIDFVMNFGKEYGYTFEHEATYEKMCLVNDAVYIAKYSNDVSINVKHAGEWTATGTQFQVPYVFKTLFSKEPIEFKDLCETKSVDTNLYLDMNETLPDVGKYEKDFEKLLRVYGEQAHIDGNINDVWEFYHIAKEDDPMANEDIDKELLEQMDILEKKIAEGHCYHFIGKVGLFCPMVDGCGAGLLMREKNGKYYAATGTKGYRWMESEMVEQLGKEEYIDKRYYNELVDEAVDTISQYGDFEWFASDEPYSPAPFVGAKVVEDYMNPPEVEEEELPFG